MHFFGPVYRNLSILGILRLWGFSWTLNTNPSSKFRFHHFGWVWVPFLVGLGSIFAQNSDIARERWVVRAWGRLHRASRRISYKDAAHLGNFWKSINPPKSPYYSKGIFSGQFIEISRFQRNCVYGGFRRR